MLWLNLYSSFSSKIYHLLQNTYQNVDYLGYKIMSFRGLAETLFQFILLFYLKKPLILDCVFIEMHPVLLHADMKEWAHGSCEEFLKVHFLKAKFLVLKIGFNKLNLFNHTAINSSQLPGDSENWSLLLLLIVGVFSRGITTCDRKWQPENKRKGERSLLLITTM